MSGKGAKTRQKKQDRGEDDSSASDRPKKKTSERSQEEVAVKKPRGRPKHPRKNPSPAKLPPASAPKEVQDPPVLTSRGPSPVKRPPTSAPKEVQDPQVLKSRGPAKRTGKLAPISVSTIYRFISLPKNNEVLIPILRLLYI